MKQKVVRLTVEVTPEIRNSARMEAFQRGISLKAFIVSIINKAIAKKGKVD